MAQHPNEIDLAEALDELLEKDPPRLHTVVEMLKMVRPTFSRYDEYIDKLLAARETACQ